MALLSRPHMLSTGLFCLLITPKYCQSILVPIIEPTVNKTSTEGSSITNREAPEELSDSPNLAAPPTAPSLKSLDPRADTSGESASTIATRIVVSCPSLDGLLDGSRPVDSRGLEQYYKPIHWSILTPAQKGLERAKLQWHRTNCIRGCRCADDGTIISPLGGGIAADRRLRASLSLVSTIERPPVIENPPVVENPPVDNGAGFDAFRNLLLDPNAEFLSIEELLQLSDVPDRGTHETRPGPVIADDPNIAPYPLYGPDATTADESEEHDPWEGSSAGWGLFGYHNPFGGGGSGSFGGSVKRDTGLGEDTSLPSDDADLPQDGIPPDAFQQEV
ncbi:uncharacterized protein DFL_009485 [Arthrobotrys flagrans]|uniref:Uncharacterized protein n=1 Tax=Arthrobotrys flagrans TaxID=97331 RepID=A0A436ZRT5_ARTFL|nr:hypothetical protein DFL_009485 [Arthrobotrys flagrans]